VKIIYTPKDGEWQEFTLNTQDLTTIEAETLEEAGGVQWETLAQWAILFDRGSFRAIRVALWMLLRRANPELDLNEVQPTVNEISVQEDKPAEPEGKGEPAATDTDST
jgi:hypothetical protein